MNRIQKIIKLIAICLAIIIIANIFSTLFYGLSLITDIDLNKENKDKITFKETYEEIERIEVDAVSSNIIIRIGDSFKVETQNIKNNFSSNKKRKTLEIEESTGLFNKNKGNGKIIIEIPEEIELEELKIDTGAGKFEITDITAKEFEMNHGAGLLNITNSNFKESDIDGGAGEINILSSTLNNLELDAGIGKINLEAEITGNSKIECGVGEININLLGEKNNYSISTEKGIGTIKINGENQSNSTIYGIGNNKLELEGGIGNINVNFKN